MADLPPWSKHLSAAQRERLRLAMAPSLTIDDLDAWDIANDPETVIADLRELAEANRMIASATSLLDSSGPDVDLDGLYCAQGVNQAHRVLHGGFEPRRVDHPAQEDTEDSRVGTSECPGTCVPICNWCLVSHDCPAACTDIGEPCPYDALAAEGPEDDSRPWAVLARLKAAEPDMDFRAVERAARAERARETAAAIAAARATADGLRAQLRECWLACTGLVATAEGGPDEDDIPRRVRELRALVTERDEALAKLRHYRGEEPHATLESVLSLVRKVNVPPARTDSDE